MRYLSALLIVMMIVSGCKQKEKSFTSSSKGQEKVVLASENSLYGETSFQLKKRLCISSRNLPLEKPARFGIFDRAKDGSIYIVDINSYSVLKFNREGEFLFKTAGKGTGPGEFRFITGLKESGYGLFTKQLYLTQRES